MKRLLFALLLLPASLFGQQKYFLLAVQDTTNFPTTNVQQGRVVIISGVAWQYTGGGWIKFPNLWSYYNKDSVGAAGAGPDTTFLATRNWVLSLPSGGGATAIYAANSQQITNAGWVNVTGATFAVAASKAYSVEGFVVYQSSATTMGVLLGFSGPASPTAMRIVTDKEITAVATAGTDKFSEADISAYDTPNPNSTAEIAQAADLIFRFSGLFVNGTNAGTFTLRLNKENVAGTGTVVRVFMRYQLLN